MSTASVVGALAVGLTGGAIVAAATWAAGPQRQTASADATATKEYVHSRTLACPELVGGDGRSTWVSLASIPGTEGQERGGVLRFDTHGRGPSAKLTIPGELASITSFTGNRAGAVHARDGMAPGSVAARTTWVRTGASRGLASATCREATSKAWLLGAGSRVGQRDRLLLLNPTDSAALVDVTVHGPPGALDTIGGQGISVPAGDQVELKLDAMVNGVRAMAIRVRTRLGLVVPYFASHSVDGLVPRGIDITPESELRTQQVIPGLPSGPGTRELVLFSPTERADVQVSVLTPGRDEPLLDGRSVRVPKGRVVVVPLSDETAGRAGSVVVKSGSAILATVAVRTGEGADIRRDKREAVRQARERVSAAGRPRQRQAAEQALDAALGAAEDNGSDVLWLTAPDRIVGRAVGAALLTRWRATVSLTAVGGPVRATVAVVPEGRNKEPKKVRDISMEAGSTKEVALPTSDGDTFAVVVAKAEGRGDLFATQFQRGPEHALTGAALERLAPMRNTPDVTAGYAAP